jgi:hypothetical protein
MDHLGSLARLAAANNAEWCDLVCRSHTIDGTFGEDAWTSPTRTPPFYPDAVTLRPDVSVPDLLARIDSSADCSIKDSFASLDLAPFGFSRLFDATWTVRRATPGQASPATPRWDVVRDSDSFVRWEQAWRGDDGPHDVLRRALLDQDDVTVLAGRDGDDVVAGVVLNRSPDVVGVSNFFSNLGSVAANWASGLAHIGALLPGAVLVGYESPDALGRTRPDEFKTAGPLRVWRRDA